jgi:hypothetical protein
VRSWAPRADGLRCTMLADEADLLASIGRQVLGLHRAVVDRRAAEDDPAMARLYPPAYADPEDAAEFRRLASVDIAAQRIRSMIRMVADLESALPIEVDGDEVELLVDDDGADAWLRALQDVRLVLHVRTSQRADELHPDVTEEDLEQFRDVAEWVGFVQGTMLEALDARIDG